MVPPAGATHTGSPRRQARPPLESQQEMRAAADVALEHVTVPHKSSATSSNRYINGRSAYSVGTDDQAPEPVNNRRQGYPFNRSKAVVAAARLPATGDSRAAVPGWAGDLGCVAAGAGLSRAPGW